VTGALAAVLGTIIPPMAIISLICVFYTEFRTNAYIALALQVMRAGVAAVIADVAWNLAKNVWDMGSVFYTGLMSAAFVATCFLNISAMTVILICLGVGIFQAWWNAASVKGGKKREYAC